MIDGQNIDAFNRDGEKPVVYIGQDENELLKLLENQLRENTEEQESTAIITKTLADAKALSQTLNDKTVTLIQSENQRLAPGVIIVPSYLAKGLEFDAVIIWHADKTRYKEDSERRLLYTVSSRAMHRLTIIAERATTPLLNNVSKNLYEVR